MGDMLMVVLKVLFILVALVMTFFILLQEGKGGGLAGLGGTKAAGVEGVTNPIRRATAVLAVIFFLLAILLGVMARPPSRKGADGLFDTVTPDAEAKAPGDGAVKPEAPVDANPAANASQKEADAAAPEAPAKEPTTKPVEKPAEKPVEKPDEKAAAPEGAAAKPEEKSPEPPAPADEKKAP